MSFAQEIRDFLSASQSTIKTLSDSAHKEAQNKYTGALTEKTIKDMNNPLNDELLKARISSARSTANYNAGRLALERQAQEALSRPQPRPPSAADVAQPASPAIGTGVATGVAGAPAPPNDRAPRPIEDDNYALREAKGGLVQRPTKKFEAGGLTGYAEDDDEEFAGPVPVPRARPAVGGTSGATEWSSRSRKPPVPDVPIVAPTDNAVDESLKYGAQSLGDPAMPTTASRMALEQRLRGAGAAPVDDMVAIYKKIDPGGKMGESERNLRGFNTLYNFKMNSGDAEGAKKVGAAMLQHHRLAFERYRAIAAAALEGGNLDLATKAAMKSYANILDEKDLKLWVSKDNKVGYSYKKMGEDGKETEIKGGIMSPQELGGLLTGQNAKTYDQYLLTAAGARQEDLEGKKTAVGKGKPPGAPEITSPGDYAKLEEQVGGHVDSWVKKYKESPEAKKKPVTDGEIASMKNVMYHLRINNEATNDELFRAAQTYMTAPQAKKGERAPFRVDKTEDGTGVTMKFNDGFTANMPIKDYIPLAAMRGKALAEAKAQADKPKEETYGEIAGRGADAAVEGLKGAGQRVVGHAIDTAKEKGFVPETYGAILNTPNRAIQEVYSAPAGIAKAIGGYLGSKLPRNPNTDPPPSDEDRPL